MKKYNVEVRVLYEYEIEVDETIYNKDWAKEFSQVFWDIDEDDVCADVAKDIAESTVRQGEHTFIEGYGRVPVVCSAVTEYYQKERGKEFAKGIQLRVLLDQDIDTVVSEINE